MSSAARRCAAFVLALIVLFPAGLPGTGSSVAHAASFGMSDRLKSIAGFLGTAAEPARRAYDIVRDGGSLIVDVCKHNRTTCLDATSRFGKELFQTSVGGVTSALADPSNLDRLKYLFHQSYGKVVGKSAADGLAKLGTVAKWAGKWAGPIAAGAFGAWKMSRQVQDGDYEEATRTAIRTALNVGVIVGVGALTTACIAGTFGVGTPACIGGAVILGVAGSMAADRLGDVGGSFVYDKGGKYLDPVYDHARRDMESCVDRTDGFIESSCSLFSFAKLTNPSLLASDLAGKLARKHAASPETRDRVESIGRFLERAAGSAASAATPPIRVAYGIVRDKEARRLFVDFYDDIVGALSNLAATQGGATGVTGRLGGLALATRGALLTVREMYGPLKDDARAKIQLATGSVLNIAGGAGAGKLTAICVLGGLKTFGVVTLACVGGALVTVVMTTDIPETLGDAAGSHVYDKGTRAYARYRHDKEFCVGRTDGFTENFCSLLALTDPAARLIGFVASETALPPGTSGLAGVAIDVVRSRLLERDDTPAGATRVGGLHRTDTVAAGPGAHGGSSTASRVTARDLNVHVKVGGEVTTTARSGDSAVTTIGGVAGSAGKVGGTYVTRVEGSVLNRGGRLEINPVKRCRVRRDGRCCVDIHRGRCVLDKYKLSKKKKKKKRRCATGYTRSGSWCYEYSDRRHAFGQ